MAGVFEPRALEFGKADGQVSRWAKANKGIRESGAQKKEGYRRGPSIEGLTKNSLPVRGTLPALVLIGLQRRKGREGRRYLKIRQVVRKQWEMQVIKLTYKASWWLYFYIQSWTLAPYSYQCFAGDGIS